MLHRFRNPRRAHAASESDIGSGAPVAGDVEIDGHVVGATNTPFTYTFRLKRIRVRDPDGGWTIELVAPIAIVSAAGYPDAPHDLGVD